MAGRKTQTVHLLVSNGKKNLTKAEIQDRLRQEQLAQGDTDAIEAPDHFTEEMQKDFYWIAEQLIHLKIFCNLDVTNLSHFIETSVLYNDVTQKLLEMKSTEERVNKETGEVYLTVPTAYTKLNRMREIYFTQMRQLSSILGLQLDTRMKLVIPEPIEEKKSKFDKFKVSG